MGEPCGVRRGGEGGVETVEPAPPAPWSLAQLSHHLLLFPAQVGPRIVAIVSAWPEKAGTRGTSGRGADSRGAGTGSRGLRSKGAKCRG